jgi:hypothetical protein
MDEGGSRSCQMTNSGRPISNDKCLSSVIELVTSLVR